MTTPRKPPQFGLARASAIFVIALLLLMTLTSAAEARSYRETRYYGSNYKCDYYDSGPPNCYYLYCYRERGYAGSQGGRWRSSGRTNCTWVYDESGPCSTASASPTIPGVDTEDVRDLVEVHAEAQPVAGSLKGTPR